jgi:hypothetical protein
MTDTITNRFGAHLYAVDSTHVWTIAQEQADANGAPMGIWGRDGWLTICDVPPDEIEPDPTQAGWRLVAVIEPEDLS